MKDTESLEGIMQAALAGRGQPPKVGLDETDPLAATFVRPADPGQYLIDVPRDIVRDAALERKARQWFHEARLPQSLVSGIVKEYCRCLAENPEKLAGGDRILAELGREWGSDCERRLDLARNIVARCSGADEIAEILESSGFGDNAWLIRSLAAFGELPQQKDSQDVGGGQ